MAEELFLSPLRENPRGTRDPRAKIILLFLYAPLTFLRPLSLQILDLIILLAGLAASGISPLGFLGRSRGFFILLLFFLGMHSLNLTDPGEGSDMTARFIQGIPQAFPKIMPLLLVYTAGILFVRTTRHSDIRRGITYLLLPLPGSWSERIGTALGLTFTMVPLLLEELSKIREAQQNRGIENIKNPVKRLALPLYPLLVNSLVRSQSLAEAMEARAWDTKVPENNLKDRRKKHHLYQKWTRRDSIFTLFVALYLLSSLFAAQIS